MNNKEDKKEVASDIITNRATPATREAYDRIMDTMPGDNKSEKFKNLIKSVEEANALTAQTGEDRSDYEDFLLHTTRLNEIFNSLLTKKHELKDQIYLEFQTQIETKDQTIADLQSKNDAIKKIVDEQKATISQLQPIVDKVDLYREEKEKAIQDSEKAVREADELKSTLTSTIASQSVQIQELQETLKDLPQIRDEKYQAERKCEKLQDKIESKNEKIESLKDKISDLEDDLKKERALREKDRDEAVLKAARQAEDERQKREEAVEKAREKESERWQSQIEKLDNQLNEERKAHAKDLDDLSRIKMEKEFKIDPEIDSLKKTVENLEEELKQTKEQLEKQKVQEDQKEMS